MKEMHHSYSPLGVTDSYVVRTTQYLHRLLFSQWCVPQWWYYGIQCWIFWYRLFYPDDGGSRFLHNVSTCLPSNRTECYHNRLLSWYTVTFFLSKHTLTYGVTVIVILVISTATTTTIIIIIIILSVQTLSFSSFSNKIWLLTSKHI